MNEHSSENNYWLGFIMGAYLDNKFDLCVDIINTFWDSLEAGPSYCRQELLFIKSDCFAKKEDWAAAIATLEQGMDNVLDKTRAQATLATLYGRGPVARAAGPELRLRPLLPRHRMVRAACSADA